MKEVKHKIIVSEPWDFEGHNMTNEIVGIIIKVVSPSCLIFKSDEELTFEEKSGQLIVLKSRYESQDLTNFEGTVGGGLLTIEKYDELNELELEENSSYVFIGSLGNS
jgi:hypothetical protein